MQVGQQVAEELSQLTEQKWTAEKPEKDLAYPGVFLLGPNNITLRLRLEGRRYYTCGEYTSDEWTRARESLLLREAPKDISSAESKTAGQLATDIKRRFLDAWVEHIAVVRKRIAEHNAHRDETKRVGDRLIAAFEDAEWLSGPDPQEIRIGRVSRSRLDGTARVIAASGHGIREESEVVFDRLRMSAEDAEAFAAWWRERQASAEQTALPISG